MNGFLNPQAVVNLLPLKEGMIVADFGCGSGFFSLAIAQIVKPSGKVIALDIWKPSLETLTFRAKASGLANVIETRWANLEAPQGSTLPNNYCDLVLMSNVLFQIENKTAVILEAKRVLKNTGKLVVIDWQSDKLPSPQKLFPISKPELLSLLEDNGFELERELAVGAAHYGFLLKLPASY
ncbi:MAG: hypothetical protein BWY48_00072 [Parcubacteria group bacterium ADurb.Bin305]|nr:class I SAM-dependent methyltransferase [Candidatus Paceibacterota bacterium]MDD3434387.1 methyltransferase domain-containing protein [Candidatus Paceibacterota bacterium]OQA44513.1 MAG: hypothetical protein BWY48_00072 [Parcubacteria group bacterium ADurb.Bin305]